MALEWVEQGKPNMALICDDSASAQSWVHPVTTKAYYLTVHSRVMKQGTVVTLIWVSVHMDIMGNERVD